jgi:hypothetical protein
MTGYLATVCYAYTDGTPSTIQATSLVSSSPISNLQSVRTTTGASSQRTI